MQGPTSWVLLGWASTGRSRKKRWPAEEKRLFGVQQGCVKEREKGWFGAVFPEGIEAGKHCKTAGKKPTKTPRKHDENTTKSTKNTTKTPTTTTAQQHPKTSQHHENINRSHKNRKSTTKHQHLENSTKSPRQRKHHPLTGSEATKTGKTPQKHHTNTSKMRRKQLENATKKKTTQTAGSSTKGSKRHETAKKTSFFGAKSVAFRAFYEYENQEFRVKAGF